MQCIGFYPDLRPLQVYHVASISLKLVLFPVLDSPTPVLRSLSYGLAVPQHQRFKASNLGAATRFTKPLKENDSFRRRVESRNIISAKLSFLVIILMILAMGIFHVTYVQTEVSHPCQDQ